MDSPFIPAIDAIKAQIAVKESEIDPLRQQLAAKEAELTPLKITANELCKLAGLPAEFDLQGSAVAGGTSATVPGRLTIRPDQFFNKELSEAVVEYLNARKAINGDTPSPATVDEIYAALVTGGYKFNGTSDANKKAALKTALTRNTTQMAKIAEDLYGLRKWYGMRAARKTGQPANGNSEESGGTTEDGDTNNTAQPASA